MACVNTTDNKLYYKLVNLCDNEKQAQDLYAHIMNPKFLKDYNIKLDDNGIPSFKDVYAKAQLKNHLKVENQLQYLNQELGSKEVIATSENIDLLCNEVSIFNQFNEMNNFVAVIERNGKNISSKVVRKNFKTDELSKRIKTNADLNNFLKSKLSELGVSVGAVTELGHCRKNFRTSHWKQ